MFVSPWQGGDQSHGGHPTCSAALVGQEGTVTGEFPRGGRQGKQGCILKCYQCNHIGRGLTRGRKTARRAATTQV